MSSRVKKRRQESGLTSLTFDCACKKCPEIRRTVAVKEAVIELGKENGIMNRALARPLTPDRSVSMSGRVTK